LNFVKEFEKTRRNNGSFYETRNEQKIKALWNDIILKTQEFIENDLKSKEFVKKIIKDVEKNKFDVNNASKIILDYIVKK